MWVHAFVCYLTVLVLPTSSCVYACLLCLHRWVEEWGGRQEGVGAVCD